MSGRTPDHLWSYEEPPRQAVHRHCLLCGLECRREPGARSFRYGCEVRPVGGEWAQVPFLPPCPAPDAAVRYRLAGAAL